jgi:hypothetical protein
MVPATAVRAVSNAKVARRIDPRCLEKTRAMRFSISIIITLGILVPAPKINAGPRPLTTRFAKYRALTQVRHWTIDFGYFEAPVKRNCRICNGGF